MIEATRQPMKGEVIVKVAYANKSTRNKIRRLKAAGYETAEIVREFRHLDAGYVKKVLGCTERVSNTIPKKDYAPAASEFNDEGLNKDAGAGEGPADVNDNEPDADPEFDRENGED